MAKENLGLNLEKRYLLFVAMRVSAANKGFDYLQQTLEIWKKNHPIEAKITEVLIIGEITQPELITSIPLPYRELGKITDITKMVHIYNAAEVFITPSLEENLPNTLMEALSCGTSCVGFEVGGIPEMIDHMENGYLAKFKDAVDMANGIQICLENTLEFGQKARKKAEDQYGEKQIAERHVQWYLKSLKHD
jgi:glycosyltransferase involved in cell wall biosynthesis